MKKLYYLFVILLCSAFGCKNSEEIIKTTETISSPAGLNSAQPNLYADEHGLYLSWQEKLDSTAKLYISNLADNEWSEPEILASGTNWFINWADYPTLAVNKNKQILSNTLPKSGGATYAYDVNLVLSPPDTIYKLHDDTTKTEHGFVSAVPYGNNKFLVVWLDGRNTSGSGHDHPGDGAMNLRAAIIDENGKKTEEWLLDDRVCDCCQTDVAIADEGPIVVYRDRSEGEIRDIYYTKLVKGQWSEPKPVATENWKIAGCPVNGPRISAKGNALAVAYFTASENNPTVKLIHSENGGMSFNKPITVASSNVIGRVDVEQLDNKTWISWMEMEDKNAVLKAAEYSENGELLNKLIVTNMNSSRKSGFPQMEYYEENLYFAWTESGDTTTIAIKRLKL